MRPLAGISQAGLCEVIVDTVDPSLDNLTIHLPFIYRQKLQFDGMQDNMGRQSSTKRCSGSYGLLRTGHSYHKEDT